MKKNWRKCKGENIQLHIKKRGRLSTFLFLSKNNLYFDIIGKLLVVEARTETISFLSLISIT